MLIGAGTRTEHYRLLGVFFAGARLRLLRAGVLLAVFLAGVRLGLRRTGAAFFFATFGATSFATACPDTGSVTPSPLPRSSSMSRNPSKNAIIWGRAVAMFWKVRHSPTKQKVWSPVLIRFPPRKPLNAGRVLRCASMNCCSFPGFTLKRTTLNAVMSPLRSLSQALPRTRYCACSHLAYGRYSTRPQRTSRAHLRRPDTWARKPQEMHTRVRARHHSQHGGRHG